MCACLGTARQMLYSHMSVRLSGSVGDLEDDQTRVSRGEKWLEIISYKKQLKHLKLIILKLCLLGRTMLSTFGHLKHCHVARLVWLSG